MVEVDVFYWCILFLCMVKIDAVYKEQATMSRYC